MNLCLSFRPLSRRVRLIGATAVLSAGSLFAAVGAFSRSAATTSTAPAAMQLIEVPARIAKLAFSYVRPADFHALELPGDIPDFEDPTKFFPLEMARANNSMVMFLVVARPAYGDGTVEDWAGYIARENNLRVQSLQPTVIGGLSAILIESTQEGEAGLMQLRTALLEDGQRMINITVMAPVSLWPSVEESLQLMLTSFRLAEPHGQNIALTRAEAEAAAARAAAAPPTETVVEPETSATPAAAPAPATAASLALGEDASTLDQDHPFNRRLLEQGAGFAPRVFHVYADERYAVVGSGALMAGFNVPLGWHVLDDGRRALVFDAAGQIQVSLNLRRAEGDPRALLQQILDGMREEQATIDPVFVDFAEDLPGLVLRNVRDGDDVLVQAYLVRTLRDDGLVHVARVTAAPDDMARAMNLAEFIVRSLDHQALLAAR